jgi:Bacterial protein of unknown function (DUF885)
LDKFSAGVTVEPHETSGEAALARFFAHYYARRPVQATFTCVHDFDQRLPDWSPDGLEAQVGEMRALRRILADAGAGASDAATRFPLGVDLALADAFLEIQIAEHESGHFVHRNPSLWTGEAIFGVISLLTSEFAPLASRLESSAARLQAIPGFLADARRVLRTAPAAWRARALRESAAATGLFREGLPRWLQGMPDRVEGSIATLLNAACEEAAAAFDSFGSWLERELSDAPAGEERAGADLLSMLLRRGHWVSSPIDALLTEAHQALMEAEEQLESRARRLAPGGWPEVAAQLSAAHPTLDDYLPRYERTWREMRQRALDRDLVTWPDAPIRYVFIPEHMRAIAPHVYYLFYRSPAPFDRLPVHYSVVTPIGSDHPEEEQRRRLRASNDSVIVLNHVIHHGGLGHHVQNFYAARGASQIGRVAAVDGASRIGMFCGGTLAEGWACYACDLADEQGFLTSVHSVAQQHTRVRLLARAVADLELHSGRRSLDETAALYRERAAMPADAAMAEAVKNSMFPGAAVMYWLGTRGVHQVRRECRARDGAAFTLRAFHDRFLSYGAIPVPLIARLMTEPPC